MEKIKNWLWNRFLPTWARQELLGENERLRQQIARLEAKIAKLNAYIDGLETGMRCRSRIVIHNGEAAK